MNARVFSSLCFRFFSLSGLFLCLAFASIDGGVDVANVLEVLIETDGGTGDPASGVAITVSANSSKSLLVNSFVCKLGRK